MDKQKKCSLTLKGFTALVASLMLIHSCTKDESAKSSITDPYNFYRSGHNINIIYDYHYEVNGMDSTLVTRLRLVDSTISSTIDYGTFYFNEDNVRNRDSLSKFLAERYDTLVANYGTSLLKNYPDNIQEFVEQKYSDYGEVGNRLRFQMLCFYNTLAKAVNRDTIQNPIEFTIFDGYILGINSFAVEEDLIINVDTFETYLNDLKSTQPQNEGIDYYLNALNGLHGEYSDAAIDSILHQYFSISWPQGTQCGCCGNYTGNCYYWNQACLIHDFLCQDCTPWYCFSGCSPTSCEGNTIEWFWW